MCGRYARKSAQELLAEWFEMDIEQMPWTPTWNAAPQSFQPVVRLNPETGVREARLLRWGLVPSWAKNARIGLNTINARAEEAAAKPAFRSALKKRRCLVPADAYYEWQQTGPKTKQPYAIALSSGEPMAFAGLWECWQDKGRDPGSNVLETFTILTTAANQQLASIHDRMPVIVERKDYDRWLESDDKGTPPVELLHPYAASQVRAWPVSNRVGNIHNNDASLLDRLDTQDELVQGQLF